MPSSQVRRKLVPPSFYATLIKLMQEAGYNLLYRFTASTDQDHHHVPVTYAQETSLLFYLPGKGYLVHMALSEDFDRHGYRWWWNLSTYLQLDTSAMIKHEVLNICRNHTHEPDFFMADCEPLQHLLQPVPEMFEPMRYTNGNHVAGWGEELYGWAGEYSDKTPLTPEQLVAIVTRIQKHFAAFLEPKIVERFNASTFVNTYAWPGIEERFWRSFPRRILREVADRPQGIPPRRR